MSAEPVQSSRPTRPQIRWSVFLPPFVILVCAVALNFVNRGAFVSLTETINRMVLDHFGWAFNLCGLAMLGLCFWIFLSPFAHHRIGGLDAKPILSTWKWFSINLCTTVAVGILFWGAAEPLYHLTAPPKALGIIPSSPAAVVNAMSTMFLHWTLTPYAIYAAPALMFAIAYYDMKLPYSIASTLAPLMPRRFRQRRWAISVDGLCLFALATGMAASLGTGILSIAGGMRQVMGLEASSTVYAFIAFAVVAAFVLSGLVGLHNGVAKLADLNTKVFLGLAVFVLLAGPSGFIASLGVESFGHYLSTFFTKSTLTGSVDGDTWPKAWTVFYWAVWLAWAPISAVFLGQISVGRTVREFLLVNLFLPAAFSGLWMASFSGTALHMEFIQGLGLKATMDQLGPESAIYSMFSHLPLAQVVIPVFVLTTFLSFVSGADANTMAMANLSSSGISPDDQTAHPWLQAAWGSVVGLCAAIMVIHAGIDGVRMLSNLGGFPIMLLEFCIGIALMKVALNPRLVIERIRNQHAKEPEDR